MAFSDITGTFTTAGASNDAIVTSNGRIKVNFSSTGSVDVQEYSETLGGWQNTGDTFTATGVYAIEGDDQRIRLNCTDVSGTITYEIRR